MKRTLTVILALALALGTTAMAEPVPTEAVAGVSAEEAVIQAQATMDKAEAEEPNSTESSANLEDAIKAFHNARIEACVESLKAELDGYVAAGKLTQEQADLIRKQFSEGKQDQGRGQEMPGRQRGQQMPGNQMPQQGGQQMPGNQMPQQGGQQMPGNQMLQQGGQQMPGGQMPQQGGQQMPDAFSGATPQMGGQRMHGNHR